MSSPSANKSLLYESLRRFFDNAEHAKVAKRYITSSKAKSLRTLDWFITTFSRRNSVLILLDRGQVVDLHASYKSMLKSHSKKRFDVFKRGEPIVFVLDGEEITTTLAQLNFFRWLITSHVTDYIESHDQEIDRAMKRYFDEKKTNPKPGTKKKRVCTSNSIVARVCFD